MIKGSHILRVYDFKSSYDKIRKQPIPLLYFTKTDSFKKQEIIKEHLSIPNFNFLKHRAQLKSIIGKAFQLPRLTSTFKAIYRKVFANLKSFIEQKQKKEYADHIREACRFFERRLNNTENKNKKDKKSSIPMNFFKKYGKKSQAYQKYRYFQICQFQLQFKVAQLMGLKIFEIVEKKQYKFTWKEIQFQLIKQSKIFEEKNDYDKDVMQELFVKFMEMKVEEIHKQFQQKGTEFCISNIVKRIQDQIDPPIYQQDNSKVQSPYYQEQLSLPRKRSHYIGQDQYHYESKPQKRKFMPETANKPQKQQLGSNQEQCLQAEPINLMQQIRYNLQQPSSPPRADNIQQYRNNRAGDWFGLLLPRQYNGSKNSSPVNKKEQSSSNEQVSLSNDEQQQVESVNSCDEYGMPRIPSSTFSWIDQLSQDYSHENQAMSPINTSRI